MVQRRDGFDGEIEIGMEGLPPGVSATGLKIGKGKPLGHLVLTAASDAKHGFSLAKITGRATINGATVTRPCRIASMEWPATRCEGRDSRAASHGRRAGVRDATPSRRR